MLIDGVCPYLPPLTIFGQSNHCKLECEIGSMCCHAVAMTPSNKSHSGVWISPSLLCSYVLCPLPMSSLGCFSLHSCVQRVGREFRSAGKYLSHKTAAHCSHRLVYVLFMHVCRMILHTQPYFSI